jgi:hypothetical protein
VIRQCFGLPRDAAFPGMHQGDAAGGGRNQGGELELHKACRRRGWKGDEVDTRYSGGK